METYVWRLAGRRVTLQTLYFLRMVPQCVTSTLRPVKMVNDKQLAPPPTVEQLIPQLHTRSEIICSNRQNVITVTL